LTTNNITYGVFGEAMQYWNFFPASDPAWGRIPVWGFADVIQSRCPDIEEGTRVYGYLPMSTEFTVLAGRVDNRGFTDVAEHRQPMAGTYNRYMRVDADAMYTPEREDHQMLLWPLFYTSFLIDDALADAGFFGARSILISSASSKTAIVAAYLLKSRDDVDVIGLTSSSNREFVEALGCYSSVVTYDQLDTLPIADAAYVDIAGNRAVTAAVHRHYDDRLKYSMVVGGTHWEHPAGTAQKLAGPTPQFFFAPAQITKRNADWGAGVLDQRVAAAWDRFVPWASEWVEFHYAVGSDSIEAVYRELLEGQADPRVGYICSL
jgi:NADPH:quinone reductase-like Zn-dependent oxidoreductase